MFSINNDQTLKNVKCQFCYSSTMEELMSLHVISEPELHPTSREYALHIFEMLPEDLQQEIRALEHEFGHWNYCLDFFGSLVSGEANYQCDYEQMAVLAEQMPLSCFAYNVLGLLGYHEAVSQETFDIWYETPQECEEKIFGLGYDRMARSSVASILRNTERLRKKALEILKKYWDMAFCREWDSISRCVRDFIEREEMSLNYTSLADYLKQFHSQLKIEDGYLIFDREPRLMVKFGQIESLTITPTIFGDNHLHGSVYQSRVNLNLNLNYRMLQISKPIPESYFQLLRALSDESRFKILKVLWNGDATTKEISDILRLSTSTVSLHLKLLREADLVTSSKVKKFVYYRLKKEKIFSLQDQTINYLKY